MIQILDSYSDENEVLRLIYNSREIVIEYEKDGEVEEIERFMAGDLAVDAYLRIVELSKGTKHESA
ncbi:MAG: hypothetical protein OHK0056_31200 [Bacteriovoracaceae bacterium]